VTLTLTKEPKPEITGPVTIRAEWNHSCTSQCPNPCPASSRLAQPGVTAGGEDDNGPAIPKIPDPRKPKD
jgi:hypothetical protein